MKNLFKLFVPVAAAAIALVSCQPKEEQIGNNPAGEITIRVHATADDLKADNQETKTYIDNNNTIIWGTGEYMKLALTAGETTTFAKSTDNSADAFNGDPEAMFEFSVTPGQASEYVYQGLYPDSAAATSSNTNAAKYKVNLPTIQNATATSYDPAAYIMVAKPATFATVQTEWLASYRRGTALNKITLKSLPSGVSINKVKITAEGKKLAGGRHFNLTTGEGSDVYGTESTIEVKYATALTGTNVDVWFTSWDVEIAEGEKLTIVAYTTDNKSYTKEITVPANRSIKFQEGYLNTLGAGMSGITPETESSFTEGDYVILAKNGSTYYALKGEASGTRIASVDYTGSLTNYSGDASLIWTIAASGSSYTIKNNGNYVGWTSGSGNAAALIAEADYDATKCLMGIDDNGDGTYKIYVTADPTRLLARNTQNEYFAFYAGTQYKDIVFVPATALEAVATPTFSPAAGEVASGTQVTISTTTSGATIYYTTDGTDPTTSSTQGTSVTITAATTIKAIAVKSGMADSEIATATYTVAGAQKTYYVKVTSAPSDWSGQYLIVYESGNVAFNGGLSTLDAVSNTISVTISDSKIESTSTTDAAAFTVAAITGGYSIKSASGYYIGRTANSNGMNTSTSEEYTNSFTYENNAVTITSNSLKLRYNSSSGQTRFRYFTSNQQVIQLYKLDASATPSVTWNLESIAVTTEPTTTVYTAGESFDPAGMVVTAYYVDADDATNTKDEAVTGYTITPSGALAVTDDHVTITYQGKTTTQAITVNAAPVVSYDFETVAELNALVTPTSAEYSGYLTDAVVSFVPATNTAIVKDATGSVMIYKSGHGLKQGQTYTGAINVTAIQYNSLYSEITAWDATFTGTETVVAPESVALSDLVGNYDDYQNAYVSVAGLTVQSISSKNINVTDGNNTYVVYYNPSGDIPCAAGEVITAVGTITKYQTTEEIKVWKAADITVTAAAPKAITFSQPTGAAATAGCSFTVSVGGSPISSGDTVASGTTVTLTANAGTDYEFTSWAVTGATVADASSASTTFVMGTSAVTISASFTSTGGGGNPTTTTYTFTSKAWADATNSWTSGKDGNQMQSGRGVQVTTGASGANATTKSSLTGVTSVVVTYSTNASNGAGSIAVKIGNNDAHSQNVTKTGGTTDRTLTYTIDPAESGNVTLTVTCTTNSIYVKSVAITHN